MLISPDDGVVAVFVAMNDGIFPVPLPASPIILFELVQRKDVPATGPVKLITAVWALLHTVCPVRELTVGVGFTVIVNVLGAPV